MQKLCLLSYLVEETRGQGHYSKSQFSNFYLKKSLSKIVFSSIKSKSVVRYYINSYFSFNLLGKLLTVSVLFQDFCYFLFNS